MEPTSISDPRGLASHAVSNLELEQLEGIKFERLSLGFGAEGSEP